MVIWRFLPATGGHAAFDLTLLEALRKSMLQKIKNYLIAHLLGLCMLLAGWYVSVIDSALDRFSAKSVITSGTTIGFCLIIIGAYLPEVWIAISNHKKK